LGGYEVEQPETFGRVIEFIEAKMMPNVVRHAVSGIASINSEDLLFEDPAALAMLIAIFSERGFHATVDVTRIGVPMLVLQRYHDGIIACNIAFPRLSIGVSGTPSIHSFINSPG
jgi:adenylate kinase